MTKVATCIYVLLVYCIKTLYQMLLIDIESGFFSHAETESEVVMLSATKQSAAGCSGTMVLCWRLIVIILVCFKAV